MGRQIAHAITVEQLFDMIGVRFNPERFDGGPVRINWYFEDLRENHVLGIQRSTIYHDPHVKDSVAEASVQTSRKTIALILGGQKTLEEAQDEGELVTQGDRKIVATFFGSLESFVTAPLIEPKG